MTKKAQMTVEEFAEKYNRVMDWNKDILESLGENITESVYVKKIIKDYLDTRKITRENCDFSRYRIFDVDGNKKELQIYNHDDCHLTYYYLCPDETEEEFKKRKIEYIGMVIKCRLGKIEQQTKELNDEKSDLETLANMLLNKKD